MALPLRSNLPLRTAELPRTYWQGFSSHLWHPQRSPLSVHCVLENEGSCSVTVEPKWKQKLAAADNHAEMTRQRTLLVQEEYKKRQAALEKLQVGLSKGVTPLKDLEFVPYLNEDGLITNCSEPSSKACVYAIFDSNRVLHYIGISRQVHSSMRLHFARMPLKCYFVKIQNINKPSRSLLELIRRNGLKKMVHVQAGTTVAQSRTCGRIPSTASP
ncbi:hypothetical protein L7F22_069362 [Adiantum nelumboides]|nr:hypothetical protein [Adiantum nelumboides]